MSRRGLRKFFPYMHRAFPSSCCWFLRPAQFSNIFGENVTNKNSLFCPWPLFFTAHLVVLREDNVMILIHYLQSTYIVLDTPEALVSAQLSTYTTYNSKNIYVIIYLLAHLYIHIKLCIVTHVWAENN